MLTSSSSKIAASICRRLFAKIVAMTFTAPERGPRVAMLFCCFGLLLVLLAGFARCLDSEGDQHLDPPGNELESLSRDLRFCEGRPDGVYPDLERGCRLFRACQGGRAHAFWCGPGQAFDPESGHCDAAAKVRCLDPHRSLGPSLVGECGGQSDGVYADYGAGCKSFYFCRGGRRTVFNCPGSLLFDWRTSRCRPAQEVSCQNLSCVEGQDGVFPDTADGCRRYYSCRDGVKSELVCPQGQLFQEKSRKCQNSRTVRCQGWTGFSCAGLPDGYYPDFRSGCRNFVLCINSKAKSFACPSDLVFNRRHLACDYPWKATCERPKEVSECSSRSNGVFPVLETNCHDFVVCRDGVMVELGSCPQGKALNALTGTCQPSSLVTCAAAADPDCQGRSDGMYPDVKSGCMAFYVCLGGNRVITSVCPGGSLFDGATATCLPEKLVTCLTREVAEAPDSVAYSQYECDGRIGVFPDYLTLCQGYKVCVDGQERLETCEQGLKYDAESARCRNATEETENACRPPRVVGTFRCQEGNGGVFVDYNSGCKTWHECLGSEGVSYSCPTGQAFDTERLYCRDATKVRCQSSKIGFSMVASIGKNIQTLPTNESDVPVDCGESPAGVYAGSDCQDFHICAPSGLSSHRCPNGSVFNTSNKLCDLSSQHNCTRATEKHVWPGSEDSFSCDSRPDGMYPDYVQDCKRYFVCENGAKTTVYCPVGTLFNELLMVCSKFDDVICKERHTLKRPSHDITTITSLPETTSSSNDLTTPILTAFTTTPSPAQGLRPLKDDTGFTCPSGKTGFFADFSSGCQKFHICFRTIRKTYSCPSVLLFNPASKTCDMPNKVDCRPRSSHTKSAHPRDLCYSKSRGYYADHASGCRKYVSCIDGKAVTYQCPSGTLFNVATWTCEAEDSVTCIDNRTVTSLERHAHGIPSRFHFDCNQMEDGFYPDLARHCHVFYRCHRGQKFSHYCKQGLLFNPKTGICDFEGNVKCSMDDQSEEEEVSTAHPLATTARTPRAAN